MCVHSPSFLCVECRVGNSILSSFSSLYSSGRVFFFHFEGVLFLRGCFRTNTRSLSFVLSLQIYGLGCRALGYGCRVVCSGFVKKTFIRGWGFEVLGSKFFNA